MDFNLSKVTSFLSKLIRAKKFVSICCIQKDENEYLPEWIEYHLKIGVSHFYIYNNNSKIFPSQILKKYLDLRIVTLIDFPGEGQQMNAYNDCLRRYGSLSKWIAFIDIDEFIVPKITNGKLIPFLKKFKAYGGVGINWLVFGSSGHKKRNGDSVINRFNKRSSEDSFVNNHVKSIVQPKYVIQGHNPHFFEHTEGMFNVNENFEKIDGPFSPHSSVKIQLNHYHCRSEEEYFERINRGCADGVPNTYKIKNFYDFEEYCNLIEDNTIRNILRKISKDTE